MLYDPEKNELVLQRPAFGIDDDDLISLYRVPLDGGGNAVTVFLTGEPYLSNDSFNDPRIIQRFARLFDARSILTVPLSVENRRIGVLHVCNKRNGPFDQNDLQLLRLLADHLAALIENARFHEREEQRIRELEKLNQVVRDQRDKLQRAVAIHERLTDMALQSSGSDGIARTLAGLVENPVAVEDKFARLISYVPYPNLGKSQKTTSLEFKGTPSTVLTDSHFREQVKLMKASKRPVHIPAYPQHGIPWNRLTAAIIAGKTIFGYVSIFEKNRQFYEMDVVAAEHAATVLALEFQKQKTAFEVEQRLKGDFLDDLLMGNYENGEVMLRRAAFLDYDLSRPHVVMVVDVDSFGAFLGKSGSDEREAANIKKKLFEIVYAVATDKSPKSLVVSKSDSVIVLLDLLGDLEADRLADPEQVAESIKREVKVRLSQISVSIAIGGKCERPEDYQHSYQIARKSLELVKTFGQRDRIVCFERLGVYQLLLEIQDKTKLKGFVDHAIGPLVSYDRKHGSSLIETLESYFQNDCNAYKTARTSFLHISSVKYRLQRIEEIAQVDLSNPETRLCLQLALKARQLME